MQMPLTDPEIDVAVLGEINQRTLVGGTPIDPTPIAAAVDVSADELAQSIKRLHSRGYIEAAGQAVSITPAGHESLQ
jgi:Mn-dependent DtxR family transcriptional regulator